MSTGSPAAITPSATWGHPLQGDLLDQAHGGHLLRPKGVSGGREGSGAGWGWTATGSLRHGMARVGSTSFPGGEMGTAAAC